MTPIDLTARALTFVDNSYVLPGFWARHFTPEGRRKCQEVLARRVQWVRGLTKDNIWGMMLHIRPTPNYNYEFRDYLGQVNHLLDAPQALEVFDLLNRRLPAKAARSIGSGDWSGVTSAYRVALKRLRQATLLVATPIEVKVPTPTVVEATQPRRVLPDMGQFTRKSWAVPIVANWEKAMGLLESGDLTLEESYNLGCILDQYIPVWVAALSRVSQEGKKSDRAEAMESVFRQCDLVADYLAQVEDASGGDSVARAKGELELQEGLLNSKFHRSGALALE